MELIVSQFVDSIFSYEGKQHKVKSASVVNNRLVVKTDRQTFVKLESEIDEISSNPSEEMYKKASAMVAASNAIVNVQLANYKYLTLK
jgi:hypothetical protein